ncbi:hypothetical protein AVDCRST_MAG81-2268 [uncultured Synechococcales cyanobacterium]|uniref:Mobile element protein n=1 Tax=uncultured Synechococcales cyanobacterium TaxID=1936017 RepID=A0A6J4VE62_9CYAN|nr:hypothetical protein AVDCRST_MAG81-2268 [uncultured Synechococcales cyanobacterium]
MQPYPANIEQQMQRLYQSLNERDRRRYAAIEAAKLGHGGIRYISGLFGCNYRTLTSGMGELQDEAAMHQSSIRQKGGGRKSAFEQIAGLDEVFLQVIAQHTAGSPMDETVKWTNLNWREIAKLLATQGIYVSVTVVDQLLENHHYRKRKAQKRLATGEHPQRNEQFENIERLKAAYQSVGNPVMSMDTKKEN